MQVRENVNDVQLLELLPNTAYALSLYALHGNAASAPLIDQGVTCMLTYIHIQTSLMFFFSVFLFFFPFLILLFFLLVPLPPSGNLKITDVTHSSMRLNWDPAPGAVRKYIITYRPEGGEPAEVLYIPSLRACDSKTVIL